VHDEIALEVAEEKVSDAAAILERTMIEAGEAYLCKVRVEVEVKIGETWVERLECSRLSSQAISSAELLHCAPHSHTIVDVTLLTRLHYSTGLGAIDVG
jgi:hypothetical protein